MPVQSAFLSPHALRTTVRISSAFVTLALFSACATDKPDPTGLNVRESATSSNGVPFQSGLASPKWQQTARDFVSAASFSPLAAGRSYPLLGVAQYLAVQKAQNAINGGGRARFEADRGAVAGASVVVLSYLFPTRTQELEDIVTEQANAGPGGRHPKFTAGEAIGRIVGADMVRRARDDGFNVVTDPPPPVGPEFWTTNAPGLPVAGGQFPAMTRWFLTSANQFRPPPPPAFGSPAFNAARDEINHLTNLPETGAERMDNVRIAKFWALNAGTPTASGFWLEYASNRIAEHGLSELEATHVYALTSATMLDATIGCWDAKLFYWLVRPWKADAGIKTIPEVGKPNHPSYPSGHSCVSSSGAAVLSYFFPEKTAELAAMVTEAGLSRMYGGIHYRFDCETGQTLGRSVAAFTIAADRSGNSVLTAH